MADETKAPTEDHEATLQAARERIVEDRRQLAEILADARQRGSHKRCREALVDLQRAIEAVDAAIQDEVQLAPSVYETRGLTNL